jgi:HEAT repeat protein
VSALTDALDYDDAGVANYAAFALLSIGQISDEIVAALAECLRRVSNSDDNYSGCGYALGEFSSNDSGAATALLTALNDDEPIVRARAVSGLSQSQMTTHDVVQLVTDRLKDENPHVREQAAYCLSRLGPRARKSLPALEEALGDEDPRVQRAVSLAISRITNSGSN